MLIRLSKFFKSFCLNYWLVEDSILSRIPKGTVDNNMGSLAMRITYRWWRRILDLLQRGTGRKAPKPGVSEKPKENGNKPKGRCFHYKQ